MKKIPIGIQAFSKLIEGDFVYLEKTPQYIYVFEFKLDKPAKEALDQINSKEYALPFTAEGRQLFKIGVSFSSETRKIAECVAE